MFVLLHDIYQIRLVALDSSGDTIQNALTKVMCDDFLSCSHFLLIWKYVSIILPLLLSLLGLNSYGPLPMPMSKPIRTCLCPCHGPGPCPHVLGPRRPPRPPCARPPRPLYGRLRGPRTCMGPARGVGIGRCEQAWA